MYGETAEIRDEGVPLSTEHGFVTQCTSLIAHADPRVAPLTPRRIEPADPVLVIPAPPDAVSVTAFLPFGEVKDLVPTSDGVAWTTRFPVPHSAEDGVYWIHVVSTSEDGDSEWFRISYTVDTTAPVVTVDLDRSEVEPGELLTMTARPMVGFLELGSAMVRSLGLDAAARAKAYVDVEEVVARVAGTSTTAIFGSDPTAEAGRRGALTVPSDLAPGLHSLEITATDVAGNKHTVVRHFRVRGPAVVEVHR